MEPSSDDLVELVRAATTRIVEHFETLDRQLASDTEDGLAVARLVQEPLPEHGSDHEAVLDLIFGPLVSKGFNTASAGALSYVTGGGLPHAAVAELCAAATNRYVAYWGACPGLAELEHTVIRWFSDMLGYPRSAGGVLLSGGSLANLSALVTARRVRMGDDFGAATVYASDQVHHSVEKAVMLAGFRSDALRVIPSDADYRIRIDELEKAVARDRAAGRAPLAVVATAGSTNTGAIDDLERVANVARDAGMWFHVDAAYGGFFALTERGRRALSGIERADTVALDPHKSLFLPFGTGCLVARDVRQLIAAHQLHSDYIHAATDLGERAGAVNFGDISAEMSREARGLRVWFPLKLLGAQAFREALDEKLDLAAWAAAEVERMPGFSIVARPQLSIFAFRAHRPGLSETESDALNRRVMERVNAAGRVHLSATRLEGRFTLRICVLSFRTHRRTLEHCLEDLTRALDAESGR